MSNSVIVISDPQFTSEVIDASQPVLVYFWASWCGPCRLMSPAIEAVATQYNDRLKVVKMEVDPNPEAVAQCQVEGVPALRLFQQGKVIDATEGRSDTGTASPTQTAQARNPCLSYGPVPPCS
ncbi:thioredoxin family protein [Leptolyngbya sp. 7M]|uniref:thioredoxin family protein n=1 Tax=Leptolyngbya sp. 7M TaxID=2812896 RepID=UPI001CECD169|nr:thioredoxin family protein [Leptolyngbya sp. 7M]